MVAGAVALVLLCVALGLLLRARHAAHVAAPAGIWARDAGEEFGALSEAERCDLVFAVAELEDGRSRALLEQALEDPSEAVALAGACALARLGHRATLERHFAAHPGERARRIARTLELLG